VTTNKLGFSPCIISLGSNFMPWEPATVAEVKAIVERDLALCDDEERAVFRNWAVEPYTAPIIRDGRRETVVVVARKGDDVLYWEDIEEGFNLSPVSSDGLVLQHWCNQDELKFAIQRWMHGDKSAANLGPPRPIT
jgi:hypothetical protein